MKSIQKEIANIQKTIKEKKVPPKQDVTLVNPPLIETEMVKIAE